MPRGNNRISAYPDRQLHKKSAYPNSKISGEPMAEITKTSQLGRWIVGGLAIGLGIEALSGRRTDYSGFVAARGAAAGVAALLVRGACRWVRGRRLK